jgi:hypothetical protein
LSDRRDDPKLSLVSIGDVLLWNAEPKLTIDMTESRSTSTTVVGIEALGGTKAKAKLTEARSTNFLLVGTADESKSTRLVFLGT